MSTTRWAHNFLNIDPFLTRPVLIKIYTQVRRLEGVMQTEANIMIVVVISMIIIVINTI